MIELIERWHKVAAGECHKETNEDGDIYHIGEYCFWENLDNEITVIHNKTYNFVTKQKDYDLNHSSGLFYRGQPALDWLRGCVERAIEARGKLWHVNASHEGGNTAWIGEGNVIYANSAVEALLIAYLEYLEGSK